MNLFIYYTLTICVLASTAAYGMDSYLERATAQLKNAVHVVSPQIRHAARATYLAAAKTGQAITTGTSNAAHTIATKCQTAKVSVQNACQTIIDSERTKAAQALLNTKLNTTGAYIKENPGKTALMTIGTVAAVCVAYKAYTSARDGIKKAQRAWGKYKAYNRVCNGIVGVYQAWKNTNAKAFDAIRRAMKKRHADFTTTECCKSCRDRANATKETAN